MTFNYAAETGQNQEAQLTSDAGANAGKGIQLSVGKMDIFNYALYLNHVSPIRGIQILNTTGDPVEGLSLHICSDFGFFCGF